jgi:beta-glucosidase
MAHASEASQCDATCQYPFQNPDLPDEARIDQILALMTLEEKIECLSTNPSVPRLGIRGTGHVEGLHGLALGGPGQWGKDRPIPTTTFPQAIGLGETWDPSLLEGVAAIEAYEARYFFQHASYQRGGLVVRAPNADLGRDPRWGRTEECYGEDPFFAGCMAAAFVRGLQGDHPHYWRAAALLKHFLANSNEDERESSSSDFDQRLWREYYSVPFRMAIEAGSRAFMAAYNAHNGIPCAVHPMLNEIARREWHQDGIICTDGGAFKLLMKAHRGYPDLFQAAQGTVRAGITQYLDDFRASVLGAVEQGLLSETEIEQAIRPNFRVMLRLGLLDPPELVPYSRIGEGDPVPWECQDHQAFVRQVTQKSVVLLKNANSFLPLDRQGLRSIAVMGALADRVLVDWYSGTLPYSVTPVDGIRRAVGAHTAVHLAISNDVSDAVRLAREADVCVVCVGNHPTGDAPWAEVTRPSYGREAVDRRSLELEEEWLIRKVLAANPRTVVVLIASFPYAIEWTEEHVPAILHLSHNSQELGTALADVLFGDYNPGGRLVQTWPRSLDQLPPMMDYDLRHGRTYLYFVGEPLYPFGYGLSYTSFAYADLETSASELEAHGELGVRLQVSNTGVRLGDEVVQLYLRHVRSRVPRPLRELKGFRRVTLEPGETKAVVFSLPATHLAYWDTHQGRFRVEDGEVEILVGRSSRQIELRQTIRVRGEEGGRR